MNPAVTWQQRAHLDKLRSDLGQHNVAVLGFEARGLPVVERRDSRGALSYAIHLSGEGVDPVGAARDLTDDELVAMLSSDVEFICRFPQRLNPAEPTTGHEQEATPDGTL